MSEEDQILQYCHYLEECATCLRSEQNMQWYQRRFRWERYAVKQVIPEGEHSEMPTRALLKGTTLPMEGQRVGASGIAMSQSTIADQYFQLCAGVTAGLAAQRSELYGRGTNPLMAAEIDSTYMSSYAETGETDYGQPDRDLRNSQFRQALADATATEIEAWCEKTKGWEDEFTEDRKNIRREFYHGAPETSKGWQFKKGKGYGKSAGLTGQQDGQQRYDLMLAAIRNRPYRPRTPPWRQTPAEEDGDETNPENHPELEV